MAKKQKKEEIYYDPPPLNQARVERENYGLNLPLHKCMECPLYDLHKSNFHPYNYWLSAKGDAFFKKNGYIPMLFVGEAPGVEEKNTGKAFQGRSGKLLQNKLKDIGIETYGVANSVQCRPEKEDKWGRIKDRKPSAKELKACFDNTEAIINHFKPQYIIPLGATSCKRFKVRANITTAHGILVENQYGKVFPMFHPSYILRSPHFTPEFEADLKVLKDHYTGNYQEPEVTATPVILDDFDDFKKVMKELWDSKLYSFDIETSGFNFFDDVILGIAFSCHPEKGYYVPLYVQEEDSLYYNPEPHKHLYRYWGGDQSRVEKYLKALLDRKSIKKVAHNGKFDVKFCEVFFDIEIGNFWFDTMLAHYLIDENKPHGLKPLVANYKPEWRNYDKELDEWTKGKERKGNKKKSYDIIPLHKLGKYAAIDSLVTLDLARIFYGIFTPEIKKLFFEFYMPLSRAYKDFELKGVQVDVEYTQKLIEEYEKYEADSLNKVYEIAGEEFNLNSPQQVAHVFYEKLKFPIIAKTDSGNPSTSEGTLKEMPKNHPKYSMIEHLLDYRGYSKMLSTYLRPNLKKRDKNNRVHPSYLLHGTTTGRLSSKGPNIQNIPREAKIKGMFVAKKDYHIVEIDYSQAELRVMAFYSKDPVLTQAYVDGEDVHLKTACFLFKKEPEDITKWERKRAKLVNFGYLYGATAIKATQSIKEKSQEGEEVPTVEEMQFFRDEFFKLYRGVDNFIKYSHNLIRKNGYIKNCFGRTRRLPQIYSPEEFKQAEALREGLNAIIQSTASDITQMGYLRAYEFLKEYKSDLLFTVHDSLIFEVHKDEIDMLYEIKEFMEAPIHPFTLPLEVDVEIFPERWGNDVVELQDWKK